MIHIQIQQGGLSISRMVLGERSAKESTKALRIIQDLQERFPNARITAISSKLAKDQGRKL